MSILNNGKDLELLVEEISKSLDRHHQIYSLPVKAELWENILSNCLNEIGINNDWRPDFNHAQGLDMKIDDTGERISCKSGSIVKEDLEFSGSRMTKYLTLVEKLDFLSDKNEDIYMLLSRDVKNWSVDNKKYSFIAFPSKLLNYSELSWKDTIGVRGGYKDKVNGHIGYSDNMKAKIQYSMSHQVWTTILDYKDNEDVFVREISL